MGGGDGRPSPSSNSYLFFAVLLVGAGVDPLDVLGAEEVGAAKGVGAEEDAGGLHEHRGRRLHLAGRLAEGDEAVVLHQDDAGGGVVGVDVRLDAVADGAGERLAGIGVGDPGGGGPAADDLVGEEAAGNG